MLVSNAEHEIMIDAMKPKFLVGLSLTNFALGIFYGFTNGPFLLLNEQVVTSARQLASSGSDDAGVIVMALCSFAATSLVAVAALDKPIRNSTLAATYVINYVVYAFFLFLASLDTSFSESIALGDWPLVLSLVIPTVTLFLVIGSFLNRSIGNNAEKDTT